ncbi:MAG: type II secretion system F family protein [bacterium]|nr:type II secretion system F family protein [bacterium]
MLKTLKEKFDNLFSHFGIGKETDYFIENLSSLMSAGIPIVSALESMRTEIRSTKLKSIIEEIEEDVAEGVSLSVALEKSGLFSKHVCALLHTGERSGKLVENLKIIAVEGEKKRALTSKIRSAAMYPIFVLSLTLVVGIGIAWFILPKLATVFSQLKVELPTITKMLIGFGKFLNTYGAYFVPGLIVVLVAFIYFLFFFKKTKVLGENILFFLPGSKTLLKQVEITRFSYLLGTLISAGLSATEALDSLAQATTFKRYQRFYEYLSESVTEGNSFKKSFELYPKVNKLLPAPVLQLIVAGEQSGTFSVTLLKISQTYEEKTDTTAKNLAVMLEPILLVIVWLGVVAVALAVIMPIYSLVGGFKG